MAKSLSDLRQLQRNQPSRINKEELIEAILSAPEAQSDGGLQVVSEQLKVLVQEINELKNTTFCLAKNTDCTVNISVT